MVTDLYARTEQSASWFEVLQNFNDVSKGLEVLRSVNITSQIAESDDGAIKEVSINRTVKRGSKDFEKQASETIDAIEQAKGN
jgi:hypothetical protein